MQGASNHRQDRANAPANQACCALRYDEPREYRGPLYRLGNASVSEAFDRLTTSALTLCIELFSGLRSVEDPYPIRHGLLIGLAIVSPNHTGRCLYRSVIVSGFHSAAKIYVIFDLAESETNVLTEIAISIREFLINCYSDRRVSHH